MTFPEARPAPRPPLAAVLAVALLLAGCRTDSPSPTPGATATPAGETGTPRPTADLSISETLRAAVEPEGIGAHLDELLALAEANDGIRAAGTPGYDASVAYVADTLSDAGYEVTLDEFIFPFFAETAPVELTVYGTTFRGTDHLRALIFSASGDIIAPVVAVAVTDAGAPIGSAGCDADDWEDVPSGAIAVTGPGGCFTRQKVDQAITAGAAAIVVANPGWPAGEVRRPTLLNPAGIDIPAVGASAEVGAALRAAAEDGASAHLTVQTLNQEQPTINVIAERAGVGPGSTADEVAMLGGHLDSVLDGPGINDNGSGTMTILEIARQLAALEPTPRTVRFAFWSAEELGLYGSRDWVERQSDEELDRIVAYLNLDMVGSPNYAREVYDSSVATATSEDITVAFGAYFDAMGLTWAAADLGGASDHAPFEDALVPTGGLFTGASEPKSDEQAERFGGSANEPMSPCYHLACDRSSEISDTVLGQMADAAAHVLLLLLLGDLTP